MRLLLLLSYIPLGCRLVSIEQSKPTETPHIFVLQSTCSNSSSTLSQSQTSSWDSYAYPLQCDLAILPEIDGKSSATVQQQNLNPCGIENVLLLEDLSRNQIHLLSLVHCVAIVNNDKVPVTPFPSTFHFALAQEPVRVMSVAFDMTRVDEYLDAVKESKLPTCDTVTCQACLFLQLLEILVARGAHNANRIVQVLRAIFFVLVATYAGTTASIRRKKPNARKNRSKKKNTTEAICQSITCVPQRIFEDSKENNATETTCCQPTNARQAGSEESIKRHSERLDEPPIATVIIDHCSDAPSLVEESTATKQPSSSPPSVSNETLTSSHSTREDDSWSPPGSPSIVPPSRELEPSMLIVLISNGVPDRNQAKNQWRAMNLLEAKGAPYVVVDGMDLNQRERRNELFEISQITKKYPQLFLEHKKGGTATFVGDWEYIDELNDASSLPEEILEAFPEIQTWEKVFGNLVRSFDE